ncbi:unnamed protein product [Anisakis simplex]|uniref:Putative cys-loop ligand gated ion channel subunit (inferred by orthology to a S. mansoni protein) n=1 Tax=Anisakis simplex TaxID=6269 RepID=A0A158PPK6_ANISI|nr:unnamed protein product [Anisakis simplex]
MMRFILLVISSSLIITTTKWFVDAKKKLKEQEIIQRALKDYDWRVRPRGGNLSWPDTGGPVLVSVNIYLRSISKIDDVNMEYSAQFTFREEWRDLRLAYERFADENTVVPPFVVLAASEQADFTQQIWMPDTFFQNEKFDTFREARRHLIDKPNVLIRIHQDGRILYSVRLMKQNVDSCNILYTHKEDKKLRSKKGKPPFLGVTTLLTMTTQSSGINAKLPPVSYTKAIDVWIGVCLAFIFGALLEFALVNYAARKDMNTSRQRMVRLHFISSPSTFITIIVVASIILWFNSIIVFPIGYACFNGEYSCARVKLLLRREYRLVYCISTGIFICALSYYLIQLYIPCIMLVVVSWVSFWLDKSVVIEVRRAKTNARIIHFSCGRGPPILEAPRIPVVPDPTLVDTDAVPARVSLGVTTLLTMTTQASGINAKLPPVSYTKAVDIWIGVCLAFIFGALLEYALVNYHGRQEFLKKENLKKKFDNNNAKQCLCPPNKQAHFIQFSKSPVFYYITYVK